MASVESSQREMFDEFDVWVSRRGKDDYRAQVRSRGEWEESKLRPLPTPSLERSRDPYGYGTRLFKWLFGGRLGEAFARARRENKVPIRFRLWLDPESPELDRLRWESLWHPDEDIPLSVGLPFSRSMRAEAPDRGIVWERPLSMLLIVSNPAGLDGFDLAEIDTRIEKAILAGAKRGTRELLRLHRLKGPPTLEGIRKHMEEGFHIVHLLAHAAVRGTRAKLFLADNAGQAQEVDCIMVAQALVPSVEETPYLLFLTTPSGEKEEGFVRLAPILIEAGAHAVVAIQAPIGQSRLMGFIEHFYETLIETGTIDVSVADARAKIYRPEHWEWVYPVLYMRTRGAQLFRPLPPEVVGKVDAIKIMKK